MVFSQFFQNKNSHHESRGRSTLDPSLTHTTEHTTPPKPTPSTGLTEDPHHLTSTTTPRNNPLSSNTSNFNWSPDVVLLRNQRTQPTPCNIITGAPLLTSNWKTLSQTKSWREADVKAPFLTMRSRDRHLKGASRLGFGVSSTPLQGYRLVGNTSRTDSAYSRHGHCSIQPSSHALTLPGQKPQNLEPRPDRWKRI